MDDLYYLILGIPVFLLSLSIHEFSHGKVADILGDPTPRLTGRLTLDPRSHLDPMGLLALIITRTIGWAKPVMINPLNFKNSRKGIVLVSLAGPVSNFILAGIAALVIHIWTFFDPYLIPRLSYNVLDSLTYTILNFIIMLVTTNTALGVFNLLPLPPLDGSKILAGILPPQFRSIFDYLEGPFGMMLVLFLVMTGLIGNIIQPVIHFVFRLLGF